MTKAIVTAKFYGAQDHTPGKRELFTPGTVIDGNLAQVAITEGWARPAEKKTPIANKAVAPEENKREYGASLQADRRLQKKTLTRSKKPK